MDKAGKRKQFLNHLQSVFELSTADLKRIMADFQREMDKGLSGGLSSLKMLPSFLGRPTGDEKGIFIALDLGGTNFRVHEVELKGEKGLKLNDSMEFVIPQECMHGTGEDLFDFIASGIESFVRQRDTGADIKLGFVFSFPVKQDRPDKGVLVEWTKDFTASGVVGGDVVDMLRNAAGRNGIHGMKVMALLNDTVATFLGENYTDSCVDMGLILGTGTNACYCEPLENIKKIADAGYAGLEQVINMEWGSFNLLEQNKYDSILDRETSRPGSQILEKMVSGLYLSHLIKAVVDDCMKEGVILNVAKNDFFPELDFDSRLVSDIEGDKSDDLSGIKDFLDTNGIESSNAEDRRIIQEICAMVSKRAARISAAGIGAVIGRLDPDLHGKHTVAVDGSLFRKHPFFRSRMRAALNEIFGFKAENIRFRDVENGSGIGGAVAAAVASV